MSTFGPNRPIRSAQLALVCCTSIVIVTCWGLPKLLINASGAPQANSARLPEKPFRTNTPRLKTGIKRDSERDTPSRIPVSDIAPETDLDADESPEIEEDRDVPIHDSFSVSVSSASPDEPLVSLRTEQSARSSHPELSVPDERRKRDMKRVIEEAEKEQLRRELLRAFPLISLESRLSNMKPGRGIRPVPRDPKSPVERHYGIKRAYIEGGSGNWLTVRRESLANLHSTEVAYFISRAGFGWVRNTGPIAAPDHLYWPDPPKIALVKKSESTPTSIFESEVETDPIVRADRVRNLMPSEIGLREVVFQSQYSFTEPATLGYVRDRQNAAGFLPHAFYETPQVPNEDTHWKLSRLQLMSLLMHDRPVVYVSDHLPRMQDLAERPKTRPLDQLESWGLKQLEAGKSVAYRATLNRIEMVGAIRAVNQCLQCHDGQRDSLLGAFSYTLERDPPVIIRGLDSTEANAKLADGK